MVQGYARLCLKSVRTGYGIITNIGTGCVSYFPLQPLLHLSHRFHGPCFVALDYSTVPKLHAQSISDEILSTVRKDGSHERTGLIR